MCHRRVDAHCAAVGVVVKTVGFSLLLGIVMQLFNEPVYQETASLFNITSVMGQLPPLNFLIAMLSQLYDSKYWSIAPSAKYPY